MADLFALSQTIHDDQKSTRNSVGSPLTCSGLTTIVNRQLFVRSLVFDETLIADYKNTPSAGDINSGYNMGLRWRQKPNGHYELTRLQGDRIVIGNFDPMGLSDQQRSELDEKIKKTLWILSIIPGNPSK